VCPLYILLYKCAPSIYCSTSVPPLYTALQVCPLYTLLYKCAPSIHCSTTNCVTPVPSEVLTEAEEKIEVPARFLCAVRAKTEDTVDHREK